MTRRRSARRPGVGAPRDPRSPGRRGWGMCAAASFRALAPTMRRRSSPPAPERTDTVERAAATSA